MTAPDGSMEFYIHAPKVGGEIRPWATINDWMHAMNRNRYAGNQVKMLYTGTSAEYSREAALQNGWEMPDGRVDLYYKFYEINRRRDPDNILSGIKFVLDGIVKAGLIKDDSQKYVRGLWPQGYDVNSQDPGVLVRIVPVNEKGVRYADSGRR